jgi:hypothetical protein
MDPVRPPVPSVRTSSLAIWSLVLGILGVVLLVICIGPLFAIPAVICGHMAYSRIKRSAGTLKGDGLALGGMVTGYVCLALALVWVPLMAAIAIPNFVKARETAQKNMCLKNLRRIEGAKEVWALRNNGDTNSTPTMQDLSPFLKGNVIRLECPAGGTYSINKVGVPPSCSIPSHDLFNPGSTIQELLDDASKESGAAKTQEQLFYALGAAAKKSFTAGNIDNARKEAEELMALLPKFRGNWNYGNAVQDANVVLGRIALREGDIEGAKRRLLEAGKSPGSPQMNSFGPNMSLAEDLLKKGERQVVLEYFDSCRNFWKTDFGKLDAWSKDVKAGRIPDFGANLLY